MRCLDYDTSVLLAFKLVKVPDISVGTPEQQRGGGYFGECFGKYPAAMGSARYRWGVWR